MGFSVSSSSQRLDILCFSHLRWHFVTQRPQHLLARAAVTQRVFFFEEPVWHDAGEGTGENYLEEIEVGPRLWVVRPHLVAGAAADVEQQALLDTLLTRFGIRRYLSWYYTPMALGFTRGLRPEVTVYDCMDELTGFAGAPPELHAREGELFGRADVVFTGGLSLFESKRRQHGNVHAFPSSIDVAHFAQARGGRLPEPVDQALIARPRAGFFGVIDERFDTALLAETARLRPEVQFVLLGPVVKIDPATLPRAANLHYLGSKSYADLPAYLAGWDVALLPFAINEATRFISPTKTPEYLAALVPVVATPVRDVVRGYGNAGIVAIAGTPEAFAAAIDRALEPPAPGWREAVERQLAQSSWDRTWSGMQREIERVWEGRHERRPMAPATRIAVTREAGTERNRGQARDAGAAPVPRRTGGDRYDTIVAGAGFAGSVLAEQLASQLGMRVLVVDRREHIGGNAYDCHDASGVLIHRYGPHIFHTNSDDVVRYLSQFTAWRPYEHRVLAHVEGKLLPIPINLDTVNRLYGLELDGLAMERFLAERAEPRAVIRTSEDIVVSRVGRELYELFFRNYTRKQWGVEPSALDASVAGRIPVRFNRDDRYFGDSFQAMPAAGYTAMFQRMLDHPRITVRTGVNFREVARLYGRAHVIYTGPIDEYFGLRYGPLPYRSLEFRHETHDCPVYQPAPVINYPNEHAYTRVTEFKYLTGQAHAKTSIVREYPQAEGDPYYPIPCAANAALYERYRELAAREQRTTFCGRLANYRYFNMDQVVAQALVTFRRIAERRVSLPAPMAALRSSEAIARAGTAAESA